MVPSTVTWPSSITSSSADCVRGLARLSSSNSTTLANTGPGRKCRPNPSALGASEPTTSPGNRSAVPCTRAKVPPSEAATVCASSVLPTPGMSSASRCPPASTHAVAISICSWRPASTELMLVTSEVASEFGPEGAGVLSEANVEVMPIFIGRVEPDLKRDPEAVLVSARCSADGMDRRVPAAMRTRSSRRWPSSGNSAARRLMSDS